MRTLRKPIAGLVMLAAVFGSLGGLPGAVQAASPNVNGVWATNRGQAKLDQIGDQVDGKLKGPLGMVYLSGQFDGHGILRLSVDGQEHDGEAKLFVSSSATRMRGWVKLNGLPRFWWSWWRP